MGAQPVSVVPENFATGCAQAILLSKISRHASSHFEQYFFKQDISFITVPLMNKKPVKQFFIPEIAFKKNAAGEEINDNRALRDKGLSNSFGLQKALVPGAYCSNAKPGYLL